MRRERQVNWLDRLSPRTRWATLSRVRDSALTRNALLHHSGRAFRRAGLALSLGGAIVLPLLTGSLIELWRQPVAPFGALSLVSLRNEMVLLCDRFADAQIPCEPGKLDAQAATTYVPTSAFDRGKLWALARDLGLGLFGPALLTGALWLLWRSALQRLGRTRDHRKAAPLAFRDDLTPISPQEPAERARRQA
jgi:hypothetical protein